MPRALRREVVAAVLAADPPAFVEAVAREVNPAPSVRAVQQDLETGDRLEFEDLAGLFSSSILNHGAISMPIRQAAYVFGVDQAERGANRDRDRTLARRLHDPARRRARARRKGLVDRSRREGSPLAGLRRRPRRADAGVLRAPRARRRAARRRLPNDRGGHRRSRRRPDRRRALVRRCPQRLRALRPPRARRRRRALRRRGRRSDHPGAQGRGRPRRRRGRCRAGTSCCAASSTGSRTSSACASRGASSRGSAACSRGRAPRAAARRPRAATGRPRRAGRLRRPRRCTARCR